MLGLGVDGKDENSEIFLTESLLSVGDAFCLLPDDGELLVPVEQLW